MTTLTKEVELVATRGGTYTIYVFKDLNNGEYIFCTKLPNWQVPNIDVNSKGFLQYQIVNAGENYYNPETGERIIYKYSNVYFINFVLRSNATKNKEIIL